MKVLLYMTSTLNGYIAASDGSVSWSDAAWKAYFDFVTPRKNIIVGSKTYQLMKDVGEIEKLNSPFTVILTNSSTKQPAPHTAFASSPQMALDILKSRGVSEAILGGGAKTNSAFLKSGLIDEICLDIDPVIYGQGIKLFHDLDLDMKLELLTTKSLSNDTLHLHYKVLR